jgi:hypothetical protein
LLLRLQGIVATILTQGGLVTGLGQVLRRVVTPVVLFVLAMAARWPNGRFLTVDEAYHWISLSRRFATAVATGNFADTFYFGHPAVTTLWLGALGHTIYQALTVPEILQEHPATFYTIMRLPAATITALALALAYPLLERLTGRTIALLAALLWIGEPFLVAHSQLFHMDATLTSLMTLSLLLMLVALQSGGRSFVHSPWWIASGLVAVMAKKFDRYALPVFPALTILAAAGFSRGYDLLSNRGIIDALKRFGVAHPWQSAGYVLVVTALVVNLIWYHPYYLAYYNPLIGGGAVARQVLPIGCRSMVLTMPTSITFRHRSLKRRTQISAIWFASTDTTSIHPPSAHPGR